MNMMRKPITKILAANRGEIAIRIFRAASELNIDTLAIYTWEDRFSLHRYKADQAFMIGDKDDPLKPYLDIEGIIRLAKEQGVDAIHPGYGFLSENPEFAKQCLENNIAWIGPSAEAMEALGDKIKAKVVAKETNVPVIEASENALDTLDEVQKVAQRIGYPVMIKAATGGGGRGMRVVRKSSDLNTLYKEASREAETAFNDKRVFIEKYIDNPKHIEVQVMGDHHGNLVHLFERDCSVQRRFQKIVEIAPAISLKQETKDALYKHALAICNARNYQNAGTVEFLVDKEENIYFIEVNTRIQVEHTITEVITGIDLVRAQILVASGLRLDDELLNIGDQSSINFRGVAIQCRITTEDPRNDFKPDYGRLIAYRSAAGFGIRLDAGNAFAGSVISPFFDSMLVKVTAWGHNITESADRLHRALREFRIRGVKTNIPFLLNLLKDENFRNGNITVNYLGDHPELLNSPEWKDRGTKILNFLGNNIVNGNPDVKLINQDTPFREPIVPDASHLDFKRGTKNILEEEGRDALMKWVKNNDKILYTDTTFRDAHQSLLATRVRTYDLVAVAESFAKHHGADLFSMEVWGGATFDVCMRFLKESPWKRLFKIRENIPNVLLQMLLRGSNGVGYKAYPDNVIDSFIIESANMGIDVFRIFDSLNWIEGMRKSIETVNKETNSIAQACICYTGDLMSGGNNRFDLQYYTDLAKNLEDAGAHMIAIKDMAGLLKPEASKILIEGLQDAIDLPIHLHSHDTSSIQSVMYSKAIESNVDVIDVALSSMSGLTSQPNFNSIVAMMQGHPRENKIDLKSLNKFSDYWENTRTYYYPFEVELKAGTAEVYDHEIPGGQYSNLRPQARGLGLENQFSTIKKNYMDVNDMLGGIVKVTPSSKVVGDMAMFLTSNSLTTEDVLKEGEKLDFPDSFKSLMRGDLGQWSFGWPDGMQKMVLRDEEPYTTRPNAHLPAVDLKTGFEEYKKDHPEFTEFTDYLSYLLYPKVFEDFYEHSVAYGDVSKVPTKAFFFGMEKSEEIKVSIVLGKDILVQFLNVNEPDENGDRLVIFRINGAVRSVNVNDKNLNIEKISYRKAIGENEIGSPLQGAISDILVKAGDKVIAGDPLFIIEAMKMESTITSPSDGVVAKIHLSKRTMIEQDDLVVELEMV
jgi:pyruvate carboxylase